MTLDEKVGQLNQYSSPFDVTGPPPSEGASKTMYDQVRRGLVGSLINVTGAEATRKLQQLAVDGSRLRIPLVFGLDVIHGYRTAFPVPLGEAASFELAAIESSARVAATEAAAAGVHWKAVAMRVNHEIPAAQPLAPLWATSFKASTTIWRAHSERTCCFPSTWQTASP